MIITDIYANLFLDKQKSIKNTTEEKVSAIIQHSFDVLISNIECLNLILVDKNFCVKLYASEYIDCLYIMKIR